MTENEENVLLIGRIGQGDESALVQLMECYKEPVFRFVYRYLGNRADCAEVTEETFFRVFQKATTYSPRATVKTWLFSIARNLSLDRLRKRKKLFWHTSLDAPCIEGESNRSQASRIDSGEANPHTRLDSSEMVEQINVRVQKLPEKLRFPFVFCILEQHSYDECAAILKVNRKTVETRIYRARKRLREDLSKDFQNF